MKSNIKTILILVFVVLWAIYITNERGEWTAKSFSFHLFASGFITGFFCLIGSCFERNEIKWVIFIIFMYLMSAISNRAKELKYRDIREREARRVEWENYQAWYNSLSPYKRLEVDNERLREENAYLQRR